MPDGLSPSFGGGGGRPGYQTADVLNYNVLKEFSRENRKHLTQAESMMWEQLRANQLGFRFRRQHIIGDYIADFVCLSSRLVIEIDGGYHLDAEVQAHDEERARYLESHGFTVLRFTNDEIIADTNRVINIIKSYLTNIIQSTQK